MGEHIIYFNYRGPKQKCMFTCSIAFNSLKIEETLINAIDKKI
jgi:hypothetical protein